MIFKLLNQENEFAHPSPLNASLGCVASNVINENPGITREEAIVKYYTEW